MQLATTAVSAYWVELEKIAALPIRGPKPVSRRIVQEVTQAAPAGEVTQIGKVTRAERDEAIRAAQRRADAQYIYRQRRAQEALRRPTKKSTEIEATGKMSERPQSSRPLPQETWRSPANKSRSTRAGNNAEIDMVGWP